MRSQFAPQRDSNSPAARDPSWRPRAPHRAGWLILVIGALGWIATPMAFCGERLTRLAAALADADEVARHWRPDAVLFALLVKTEADGAIDLGHLVAPPVSFDGGMVSAVYRSTSAMQDVTLAINTDGTWSTMTPLPIAPGQSGVPVARAFLDLDQALALARQRGLPMKRADGKAYIDARLTAERNVVGGKDATTWTFTALDMSGPYPVPSLPVVIDAATGAETTGVAARGEDERNRRVDEQASGRPLPAVAAGDIGEWLHFANQFAVEIDSTLQLYEVSLAVSYADRRLRPLSAMFRYFTLSPDASVDGAWAVTEIAVDGRVARVASREQERSALVFFPRAVPLDVEPPHAALASLWQQDLRASPERVPLLLFHSGVTPLEVMRPADPLGPPISDDPRQMPPDRWLWRTVAERDEQVTAPGFRGSRPVQRFVYRDAATGVSPRTPLLDPALAGTWERNVPGARGQAMWTWVIEPGGAYSFSASGDGAPPAHRGVVHACSGRWTQLSTTSNWSDGGTYHLQDPSTLVLEGQLGAGTWQRKAVAPAADEGDAEQTPVWSRFGSLIDEPGRGAAPAEPTTRRQGKLTLRELALGRVPALGAIAVSSDLRHAAWRLGSGYDDDSECVIAEDGSATVAQDGVAGAGFHELAEPVFSSTGRCAYLARRGERWFAVVDGVEQALPFTTAGALTLFLPPPFEFSPDGARWALPICATFTTAAGALIDEHCLLVDGAPASDVYTITVRASDAQDAAEVHLSLDDGIRAAVVGGGHVAYTVHLPGPIVARKESNRPDGSRTVSVSRGTGLAYVVSDGVPGPEFDYVEASSLRASSDGGTIVYLGLKQAHGLFARSKWHLVRNGALSAPLDDDPEVLALSPDGRFVALSMGATERRTLRVDGPDGVRDCGPFDDIALFRFGAEGRFGCVAWRAGTGHVVVDGKVVEDTSDVVEPHFSPDGKRVAYAVERTADQQWRVVLDGEPSAPWDGFVAMAFSGDSRHFAYVVTAGQGDQQRRVLVVDGKQTELALGRDQWIHEVVLSPDGGHRLLLLGERQDIDGGTSIGPAVRLWIDGEILDTGRLLSPGLDQSRVAFANPDRVRAMAERDGQVVALEILIGR